MCVNQTLILWKLCKVNSVNEWINPMNSKSLMDVNGFFYHLLVAKGYEEEGVNNNR